MKIAKVFAVTGTIVMFFTLAYGFIAGDFFKEGSILFSMAWGKVSLIDVYVGFFLFAAWVLYREEKWWTALLWIISIMILGNLVTCLYATIALYKSGENYKRFWLGQHFD
jgi:hypothetical protein